MSKLDYRVRVDKRGFQRLQSLAFEASDKCVKAFGTIYARAMASATPPHSGRGAAGDVLRSKKQKDIVALQRVIAQNIAGVDDPRQIEGMGKPVPFRNLGGQWMAVDTETRRPVKPRGAFGFIVPTSWARVRGESVPETDPAQVYAGAIWDGKKMVPRRYRKTFVRKAKLQEFVRMQQRHAGKLISGWAPGARVFAMGKNIAAGFFAELGGKGFGRIFTDKKGRVRGWLVNRQAYNSRQNALLIHRMPGVIRMTKLAREVQVELIKKWYSKNAKKVFGV